MCRRWNAGPGMEREQTLSGLMCFTRRCSFCKLAAMLTAIRKRTITIEKPCHGALGSYLR